MALEEERLEEGKKTHKKVERNNDRRNKQWAKVRLKAYWIGKVKKEKKIKEYVPVIEGSMREEANEGKTKESKDVSRLPFARPAVPYNDLSILWLLSHAVRSMQTVLKAEKLHK